MQRPVRRLVVAVVIAGVLYLGLGVWQLFTASGINLVHAAVFSTQHWRDRDIVPLPATARLARWRIETTSSEAFRELFEVRWQANSYGVFMIAIDQSPMNPDAMGSAAEVADLLRRRGLPDFALDGTGCSSGHRAKLEGLVPLTRYLVAHGLAGPWPGNPESSVAECRAAVLLQADP
jgi:hypothetical protein